MGRSLAALCSMTLASGDCDSAYQEFLVNFPEKQASGAAKTTFCASYDAMEQHNSLNGRWAAGINMFSDIADISDWLGDADPEMDRLALTKVPSPNPILEAVDWRSRMPAVKDQGQCASCWTFGATAVVDFFSGVAHSEQQIGDCSSPNICNGGSSTTALSYLADGVTHCLETDYPYQGKPESCQWGACSVGAHVSNVHQISGHDAILAIVQNQVMSLSFAIQPSGSPFVSYKSGVWDADCGTGDGHAVAVVGYNSDYWIIRNSWGASWGQAGYVYFKKGTNLCEIEARRPVYATASSFSAVV